MREIAIAALVVLGGCTEHGRSPPGDARKDGPGIIIVDAKNVCGSLQQLSGELIDIDSTAQLPKGVGGAQLTLAGQQMALLSTPPSGRIDACISFSDPVRFSLEAPGDYLDGVIVLQEQALQSLHP